MGLESGLEIPILPEIPHIKLQKKTFDVEEFTPQMQAFFEFFLVAWLNPELRQVLQYSRIQGGGIS